MEEIWLWNNSCQKYKSSLSLIKSIILIITIKSAMSKTIIKAKLWNTYSFIYLQTQWSHLK